jgi:hypothetical protein
MNESEFKKIFADHKFEVPDDGFTDSVVARLPARGTLFPRLVMAACIAVGLSLTLFGVGVAPVWEQLKALADALSRMEMPPAGALAVYFSIVAACVMAAYSLAKAGGDPSIITA